LQDSNWHSVKEIKEEFWLPEEKLVSILNFMADFDLISSVDDSVKIMPSGLSFLRLPPEGYGSDQVKL
jgi:hypothetical protein